MSSNEEILEQLCAGCAQIISRDELVAKLRLGRPLRVKLGADPTSPDLHLGHLAALRKLRQFQDFGHEAILILGDFTAMIGDPSGRSATRPQLTHAEVLANARTYQDQVFKVLLPERTKVVFNGEWFKTMSFEDVIRLNSRVTLQQMLQREDFRERLEAGAPIHAHEIQYPLMQGWDSVQIESDVELGGTDQLFNILVGRDLQREEGQPLQVAMMLPLLEGTDGVQKMSKSLGNSIGIADPPGQMFGKIMSIPDAVMQRYFELLLGEAFNPTEHPMMAKKRLARQIVASLHDDSSAGAALTDFEMRFSTRDLGSADLPVFRAKAGADLVSLVLEAYAGCFAMNRSRAEVRRLIEQGSVQWKSEKVTDPKAVLPTDGGGVLKLDKTRAVRIG